MDLMLCIWFAATLFFFFFFFFISFPPVRFLARLALCRRGGTCDDLWGNLTLKRMQMKQGINIQRRSLADLSRCKTISIGGINIQQRRAGEAVGWWWWEGGLGEGITV